MAGAANQREFLEQVEACRPGSEDLRAESFALAAEQIEHDGAAREYYSRVQQSDARLSAAFRDLPVPEGLADRLLAALDAAQPQSEVTLAPEIPESALPAHGRQRRWLSRLAIAASVLAVVGGGLVLRSSFAPYSNQQCLVEAKLAGANLQAQRWSSPRVAPETRRPQTRLFSSVKGWQPVSLLGDSNAVAYRFSNGATLFVAQPSKAVAGLPTAPPAVPQQRAQHSAGTHIGMWTSGGLVHVLMVSGPIEDYRRMTGTTRPVVAQSRPQSLPNRHHS